jgi:hypothetical protein
MVLFIFQHVSATGAKARSEGERNLSVSPEFFNFLKDQKIEEKSAALIARQAAWLQEIKEIAIRDFDILQNLPQKEAENLRFGLLNDSPEFVIYRKFIEISDERKEAKHTERLAKWRAMRKIPDGCVPVFVEKILPADGWNIPCFVTEAGHEVVDFKQVHVEIFEGEDYRESSYICWMPKAAAAAIDAAAIARKTEWDKAAVSRDDKLLNTPIPPTAIAAYISCEGDPENLQDNIDHPQYWLVKKWSPFIERQGAAAETTFKKINSEMRKTASLPTARPCAKNWVR